MENGKLLWILGIIIIFNGCTSYNLNVAHNEIDKTTTITLADKSYILIDSKELRNDKTSSNLLADKASIENLSYISEDVLCKSIKYRKTQNLTTMRKVYNNSSKEDTYKENSNKCTTQNIKRIQFHDCDFAGVITKDVNGQYGIEQKKYIKLENKKCFYMLRDLLKEKDTISVQKKYKGIFTSEVNKDKCGTGGALLVFRNLNNKIYGTASYLFKGKKVRTKLWGEIKENEFHGETRNVKFYGDITDDINIIKGEYFNRSCKGTFQLKSI